MATVRPHYIDVDLKKPMQLKSIYLTQNDTDAPLIMRVYDNGYSSPEILDRFTTFLLTSQRADGESFDTMGERIEGTNEISFELGTSEISIPGEVTASAQLYGERGRWSTTPFTYEVGEDLAQAVVPTEKERSLIELVLNEGPEIVASAREAAENANRATDAANTARDAANTAAGAANTAASNANSARTNANNAATAANTARDAANTAARSADDAAEAATDAAAAANAARDAANTAAGNANTARNNANTAAGAANTAATSANNAASAANTARDAANTAAGKANTATDAANSAAGKANVATTNANSARDAANAAAGAANTAAGRADDAADAVADALENGPVVSVNGKNGAVTLSAADVGAITSAQADSKDAEILQSAKNYADNLEPDLSGYATTAQLNNKVDKVTGKGLSTNDYTTAEKNKLGAVEANANNYQHPATHPASMVTGLASVAVSGSYNDLANKPSIPAPVTLNNTVTSTSTTQAATANAVKQANDNANDRVSKSGDVMDGILTARSNTSYTTRQVRNMIISPNDADNALMQNGDIWIKYK